MENKVPGYALHGYQPVAVDETVLSAELRSDAFEEYLVDCIKGKVDDHWQDVLSYEELAGLEGETKGPCVDHNQQVAQRNLVSELRQLSHYRRYARRLYSGEGRAWYGDGAPPWKKAG